MDRRDAFLQAILENPHEDTHRLVYADWLEENGDAPRARFIRWQCRGRFTHPYPACRWRQWFDPWWTGKTCRRQVWDEGPLLYLMRVREGADTVQSMSVTRGFVARVKMSRAVFWRHAGELFHRHPITEVCFSDAEPFLAYRGSVWAWSGSDSPGDEPPQLSRVPFDWLVELSRQPGAVLDSVTWVGFSTRAEAKLALSNVIVARLRKQIGLPALPAATAAAA
jgi:uncharacterized protein (TIGR02996 family)